MTQHIEDNLEEARRAIWYSSDLHFSHANIINYTNRGTTDIAAMNDNIIDRWNSVVGDNDTVWVLGDVALGKIDTSLELVQYLNGTKILVPGNHDRCWAGNRKGADTWRLRYLDAGFDQIQDNPDPVTLGGQHCHRSHFPYRGGGDSQGEERYSEHRLEDRGGWLLCGHVHDAWRQNGRQINVGIDAWGGYPVSVDTLAELVEHGPANLPPLPW